MKKIIAVFALVLTVLVSAPLAEAQKGKVPRIGFLGNSSPARDANRIKAFRKGLTELGYVEGKNIVIEFRYAGGKLDRLTNLAAELVRMKVDVIVTRGGVATRAAMKATKTIPIVMAMVADPVRSKMVASLARPGGNVTGLTTIMPELTGKQLELLREIVPKLSRVAFLGSRDSDDVKGLFVKEAEDAGRVLGIQIQLLQVNPDEFKGAFSAMVRERAGALAVQPFFVGGLGQGRQIADLAVKSRLPAISTQMKFVHNGGLISYGSDVLDLTRRAAYFVDKLLKGAKPADLPVEQPTKFVLGINLKTAKALGITIPPEVLFRATKVIK